MLVAAHASACGPKSREQRYSSPVSMPNTVPGPTHFGPFWSETRQRWLHDAITRGTNTGTWCLLLLSHVSPHKRGARFFTPYHPACFAQLSSEAEAVSRFGPLSKEADESAGRTEHGGEREGDGEEDVLVGYVGVEAAVVDHEQDRGHRYPRHEGGSDAQRVQGPHL